jgi:hypothetical protein
MLVSVGRMMATQMNLLSGVSLTSGGTTKQQGHLTVGDGLLGQIVVDDEGVLAVVTEPFTDGTSSEGGQELKRGSLGSGGSNDNGVLHGVVLLKGLDELSDSGTLLTNSDVHTVQLLGLVGTAVPSLLVQDGVESDGSLTSLTVTDNQLTLTTSDRNHGVDGLKTSLDRLTDGGTGQNAGGLDFSAASLSGVDGSLSIDGVTQSVDDTSEKGRADGNVDLHPLNPMLC